MFYKELLSQFCISFLGTHASCASLTKPNFSLRGSSPSVLVSRHHRSRTWPSRAHAHDTTRRGQRQKQTKRTHPRPRRNRKETTSSQTKRLAKHSLPNCAPADQHSPTPSVPSHLNPPLPPPPFPLPAATLGCECSASASRVVRLDSGSYHP